MKASRYTSPGASGPYTHFLPLYSTCAPFLELSKEAFFPFLERSVIYIHACYLWQARSEISRRLCRGIELSWTVEIEELFLIDCFRDHMGSMGKSASGKNVVRIIKVLKQRRHWTCMSYSGRKCHDDHPISKWSLHTNIFMCMYAPSLSRTLAGEVGTRRGEQVVASVRTYIHTYKQASGAVSLPAPLPRGKGSRMGNFMEGRKAEQHLAWRKHPGNETEPGRSLDLASHGESVSYRSCFNILSGELIISRLSLLPFRKTDLLSSLPAFFPLLLFEPRPSLHSASSPSLMQGVQYG